MSESEEMSEFGYIMELLARGKASAMYLPLTPEPSQLPSKVREGGRRSCEIPEVGEQALTVRT
ncbi:E3 ubiquitin-protein ligase TRIM36 isoform X4 [Canis lupus familiaris]|uniref:E3 ubiquitin-protein ligase TRIM36 isoform X4 n=1 Tax=Canis lupus familiaris TaxID=9615 RepID=UPI000BAA2EE1|nr:E3 ubiquitin-protein ligase TRIM36 isoform X4 [Canis lupus familiaris]XP_038407760.1 E3 ubiquitin-protein ligase TRIM36 isoform X4 [Canis lupus familiaris]XP_038537115.1 E3 ubiquitin-protein ligase TRIM36 isoform X4 [Canis lupus familiaris]|eukprot:XP_022280836.1 E3 ubiquitin-protein ligase TRIM36 isoform X3 [Canis lupus familiaris]